MLNCCFQVWEKLRSANLSYRSSRGTSFLSLGSSRNNRFFRGCLWLRACWRPLLCFCFRNPPRPLFLPRRAKFLFLLWNDRQVVPGARLSLHRRFRLGLRSSSTNGRSGFTTDKILYFSGFLFSHFYWRKQLCSSFLSRWASPGDKSTRWYTGLCH